MITLTDEEKHILSTVLEYWEDGLPDAVDDTLDDEGIEDMEQLLTLTGGLNGQRGHITRIRTKLGLE